MAPSAETAALRSNHTTKSQKLVSTTTTTMGRNIKSSTPLSKPKPAPTSQRKTIAFAVNYEPSLVDRFTSVPARQSRVTYEPTSAGTGRRSRTTRNSVEDDTFNPAWIAEEDGNTGVQDLNASSNGNNPRRSTRDPKRKSVNMTQVKVRYDMECVPIVERTPTFWKNLKVWPPRPLKDPTPPPPPIMTAPPTPPASCSSSRSRNALPLKLSPPTPVPPAEPTPLNGSVIWSPSRRKDWEDSVSELTAVCTSAGLRRFQQQQEKQQQSVESSSANAMAKFVPPLSREYIKDRIDIDDPLRGYQIRHSMGGWLQGFVLWTNFTTWTHFFTWDSLHPESGIPKSAQSNSVSQQVDWDGSLANELQALPRHGDPSNAGIVFDNVAEIALLGGLGCGELLLRMALEDILKSPQYKYIVLQATSGSRSFYERFGFRRVGAVCRYGESPKGKNNGKTIKRGAGRGRGRKSVAAKESSDASTTKSQVATIPTLETPIQGYRHWTHANESQHSLDLHGGPSYMMCLKLPEEPMEGLNLIESLAKCFVDDKPSIESIGAASTPNPKRKLKSLYSTTDNTMPDIGTSPPLPNILTTPATGTSIPQAAVSPLVTSTRPPTSANTYTPTSVPNKRRKVSMDKVELGEVSSASLSPLPLSGTSTSTGRMPPSSMPGYPPMFALPPPPHSAPHGTMPGQQMPVATSNVPPLPSPFIAAPNAASFQHLSSNRPHPQAISPIAPQVASVGVSRTGSTPKSGGKSPKTTPLAAKPKNGTKSTKPTVATTKKSKPSKPAAGSSPSDPLVQHKQAQLTDGLQKVDRLTLVKQKVKSYPRDRLHFYNRVVQPKNSKDGPFYFVLHYEEPTQMLLLCPMAPKGILSGKRQGRPRYQCVLEETSKNWVRSSTSHYKVVSAFMVMKTPLVAQEAWDVLSEP